MKALTDTDLMPLGKHRGKPMGTVPSEYLCQLWNIYDKRTREDTSLGQYIKRSMKALKKKNPDLIFK